MDGALADRQPLRNGRIEPLPPTLARRIRIYLELTKLRIVTLLLFTTLTAMVIAARGVPELAILLPTLMGGALSAAGASVINQYLDRDLDAKMNRTARRPIPSGRVEPINALLFGLTLIIYSTLVLAALVNWLTAILALFGAIYYVVIYTMWLKRSTAASERRMPSQRQEWMFLSATIVSPFCAKVATAEQQEIYPATLTWQASRPRKA